MKKYVLFLIVAISLFVIADTGYAQQPEKCGSADLHNQLMATDPLYQARMQAYENAVQSSASNKTSGVVYRIPVVVHVMHKGEAIGTGTNLSDDAIKGAIRDLNYLYRKVAGYRGDGNGVDVEIEYALAVRDPNGNCTNGIVRVNMSGNATYMNSGVYRQTAGITDAALKATSVWNQNNYYNIWLVSEIDNNNGGGGVQGYAFFASSHGGASDGAVILGGKFVNGISTTHAHELGHSLNLYHTFEGDASGTTCPAGNGCGSGVGDCCADVPPHIRSASNCNTAGTNSCDGGSSNTLFVHNYMDYSSDDCTDMFTANQKTRMQTALTTTRASFLESNGNMSLLPVSVAAVDFTASSSTICTGQTVTFEDKSGCIPNTYINTAWNTISFNWTITNNAGTTYTSTLQNPTITFAVAGTYNVTLAITNSHGTTTHTKQGAVIVAASATSPTCTGSNNSPTTNLQYGIYVVKLNTLTHNSSGTYEDIQSGVTNATGYGNFVCTAGTILEPNTTYTISLQGSPNTGITEDFKAYIDYNNDGDFLDAAEAIASWDDIVGNSGLLGRTFTTPASPTLNTSLRMRVFGARSTETITPCFTTARGQIHDYSVRIVNNIAKVTIATAPGTTITYGTNVTFTASPVNGGSTPVYAWYKNGVLISGATAATYATTTLLNADKIYCVMTSNLANVISSPCTSNVATMTVTGPPQSDFTANKTGLCAGGNVSFNDISVLSPTSWAWTFTGGTPASSTAQNPTVTYNTPGTYAVTLTASNGLGTGTTKTKTSYITVYAVPTSICSGFTRSAATGFGIGITNVTLNTINNTTAYDDAVIIDNACSINTTLQVSTAYNISVTVGATNNQWVRVYIDYNKNNSFADSGELVFSPAIGTGVRSGTFTVPAGATTGAILRMRVISDFTNTTAGSCTTPLQYGQAEDYGIIISAGCAAPTITGTTPASRCGTGTVTLGATASAGTVNWYTTSTGGSAVATGTSYTTPSISGTTTYYVDATNSGCTTPTRTAVTATVSNNVTPSVTINASASTICTGTSVTFTATPTNGGAAPGYQWKVNGTNVGTNSATYTTSSLTNGQVVTCVLTSNASCASPTTATSSGITMTVNANVTPSVTINASATTICSGASVTFTATPANGGASPVYQWKVNGTNVGTNSTTYTTSSLTNGQVVTCVLTSNASCASPTTATSSGITMTVNANVTPSVTINASATTICTGTSVTFTATPANGGASPVYQWKVNGTNVGTNSATYTTSSLTNGQVVTCVLTSNASCASPTTATSSGITMTVNNTLTPAVSIAVTSGSNPTCSGSNITFTATPTNGGSTPAYQWKVNGTNVGTNSATYSTSALTNGQVVTCVMTSNSSCASPTTATSSGITITVNSTLTPAVSVAVTGGSNPSCAGNSVTFTATPTNGGTTPAYQWKVDGTNAGTNSATYSTSALTNGQVVTCVMTSNSSCASPATATSTGINMVINTLPAVVLSVNPDTICSNSSPVTLSGGTPAGGTYSGSGILSGQLDPTQSGTGTVQVVYTYTNAQGCTEDDTSSILVKVCTGVKMISTSENIRFSPNPNDGTFTISGGEIKELKLVIFNLIGQEIIQFNSTSDTPVFLDLKTGIYIMEIQEFGSNKILLKDKILINR